MRDDVSDKRQRICVCLLIRFHSRSFRFKLDFYAKILILIKLIFCSLRLHSKCEDVKRGIRVNRSGIQFKMEKSTRILIEYAQFSNKIQRHPKNCAENARESFESTRNRARTFIITMSPLPIMNSICHFVEYFHSVSFFSSC